MTKDLDQILISYKQPDFVERLTSVRAAVVRGTHLVGEKEQQLDAVLNEVGQAVDVVTCGDDVGAQHGLQISHDHYLKYVKPRHEKYFRQVHDLTMAKLLYHTCGSVVSIIDDLIEIGVDALNPVQVSAAGMDPAELKRKYRRRMAFWGAMDTHHVLPKGSVNDVKKMVEARIEQMGEGGGYVLSAVHNIQPDVPLDNILAMFEHAREYVPSFVKG